MTHSNRVQLELRNEAAGADVKPVREIVGIRSEKKEETVWSGRSRKQDGAAERFCGGAHFPLDG